jgi:phospholipid/cholesterol/gamma-HCH transport system ATP-binding protein
MIKVEELSKSFNGLEVLRGASFEVARGEILALIGLSGHGKSVILKHVAGLLKPDRGRVYIDGKDISILRGEELEALRSRFGFLFQGGALFSSLTAFEGEDEMGRRKDQGEGTHRSRPGGFEGGGG